MSGFLPFTRDEFLGIFAAYNQAVWPAELLGYGLAILSLAALVSPGERYQKLAGIVLAAMWLWTGIAYHWIFFAPANGAATLFAALFVAEGLGLLAAAARSGGLGLHWRGGPRGLVGSALIVYALILYPAIGFLNGDSWPRMPAFGITPCPVTLFTLGMLLFARRAGPLWVGPLLWAAIGGSATLALGMAQDLMLLVAGPTAAAIVLTDRLLRRHRAAVHDTGGSRRR